ncbi:MAG: hypothetical protein VX910_01905 [Candidatus Latescibacterota bacterium]|nr:hypothetical protein [Candidatus Latescibacterota bacterium]
MNDAFQETLIKLDDEGQEMRYTIDDGSGPVNSNNVTGDTGKVEAFLITGATRHSCYGHRSGVLMVRGQRRFMIQFIKDFWRI